MKYLFSRLPYLKLSNIHYTATSNVNNLIFKKIIDDSYDKKLQNNENSNNNHNNDNNYNNDNNNKYNDEIKYYNQNYNIKKNSDWKFEW